MESLHYAQIEELAKFKSQEPEGIGSKYQINDLKLAQ